MHKKKRTVAVQESVAAPAAKKAKAVAQQKPDTASSPAEQDPDRFVDFSDYLPSDCKKIVSFYSNLKQSIHDRRQNRVVFAPPLEVPAVVDAGHILKRYTFFYRKNSMGQHEVHMRGNSFVFPKQTTKGWPFLTVEKEFGEKKDEPPVGVKKYFYELSRPLHIDSVEYATEDRETAVACVGAMEAYFKDVCRVGLENWDRVADAVLTKLVCKPGVKEAIKLDIHSTIDTLLRNMLDPYVPEGEDSYGTATEREKLEKALKAYFRRNSPFKIPERCSSGDVGQRGIWIKKSLCTLTTRMDPKWAVDAVRRHLALEKEMQNLIRSGTLDVDHLDWASSFLSLLYSLAGDKPSDRRIIEVETSEGKVELQELQAVYNGITFVQVYKDGGKQKLRIVPFYEIHFNPHLRACDFYIVGHNEVVYCGQYSSKKPTYKFVVDSVWLGSVNEEFAKGEPTTELDLGDDVPEFPGVSLEAHSDSSASASSSSAASSSASSSSETFDLPDYEDDLPATQVASFSDPASPAMEVEREEDKEEQEE